MHLLQLPPLRHWRLHPLFLPKIPLNPDFHLLQHISPWLPLLPNLKNTLLTPNTPRPHQPRHKYIRPQSIPNNSNLIRRLHYLPLPEPLYNLISTERLLPRARRKPEYWDLEMRELGFEFVDFLLE